MVETKKHQSFTFSAFRTFRKQKTLKNQGFVVAGTGFEPVTFWL